MQGQSRTTRHKEIRFESILKRNVIATSKIRRKWAEPHYIHIDLNCGSGWNEDHQVAGSPVVFWDIVKEMETPWMAYFVDNDASCIKSLLSRIPDRDRCTFFNGSNQSFLTQMVPNLLSSMDFHKVYGSVLSDPNGPHHPVDELAHFSTLFPRVDIILSWSGTQYKRCAKSFEATGQEVNPYRNALEKARKRISKTRWQISTPLGPDQWTVIYAANYRLDGHKAIGLYDVDSPEGQECLEKLCKTAEERANTRVTGNTLDLPNFRLPKDPRSKHPAEDASAELL